MNFAEAIKERHSVRAYTSKKIEGDVLAAIEDVIADCNHEYNLDIQLITDESKAFATSIARKAGFSGVRNYITLVGNNNKSLKETCGYCGERIVLTAQTLGLNTCWVAGTYNKKAVKRNIERGKKLVCIIAVGYGESSGVPHKNRSIDPLCKFNGDMPHWFMNGMEAAMLAPTAMNKQKFCFRLVGKNSVEARARSGIDLGIVKYHFQLGAGKDNFKFI